MSDVQTGTVNEFGTVVQPGTAPVQGGVKEATLDDILAAVRGIKLPDTSTPIGKSGELANGDPAVDKPTTKVDDPVATADIDTGSKALDIAVRTFIASTNASQVDIERATAKAIEYNDAGLIDEAFLRERFGDRAAEAKAIAEAVIEQADVKRQQLVQSVYSTAGGKEGWESALALYKEHAPKGLQKALQMMFDSGDDSAVQEAANLVVEFANNSGLVVKGAGSRQVAGSGSADSQGLSAREFQAAMAKLNPGSRSYRDDYARLIELRGIGKQLGK